MKRTLIPIALSSVLIAGCSHDKYASNENYQDTTYGNTAVPPSSIRSQKSQTIENITVTPRSSTSESSQTSVTAVPSGGDTTMVTEIRNSISKDPTLATIAPKIQINAASGTVTLSGSVKSEQEKERIAELVRQTTGVVTVNNQLTVSAQSQSSTTTDTSATTQTATSQSESTIVGGTAESKTDTREGLTQNQFDTEKQGLSPTSDRPDSSSRIYHSTTNVSPTSERSESRIYSSTQPSSTTSSQQGQTSTAQGTTGAQGQFSLNIQATTEADRTLGQKIMQELRSNSSFAATIPTIRMSLTNGKVVLKGNVKSETEKQQIESAVQRVTGVASVDNQLQVSATPATDTGGTSSPTESKP